MLHHQATSSTFEFLHIHYRKSQNEACKGGGMYVLKSSSPLCCGFLHLFPMSEFGIISYLLRGREIYEVVCLQATSQGEHKFV
jgi:hypothetical protein